MYKCEFEDWTYVGLGDEIESFQSAYEVGVKSLHVNTEQQYKFRKYDYELENEFQVYDDGFVRMVNDREYKWAIIIPSTGGKTYLSTRLVDAYDIDEVPVDDDYFKRLRRRALIDPSVWKQHNQELWTQQKDYLKDTSYEYYLMHSIEQAKFLGFNFIKVLVPDKLSLKTNRIGVDPIRIVLSDSNIESIYRESKFYRIPIELYAREELVSIVKGLQTRGQRKLEVMDRYFIESYNHVDVIYVIGSSPGLHFEELVHSYYWKKFIFIDPRPLGFMPPSNVTVYERYLFNWDMIENDNFLVIWDVRTEREDRNNEDWEQVILDEHELGIKIYSQLLDTNCVAFSMKLRYPRIEGIDALEIPLGEIKLQPWTWGWSTETRLFVETNRDVIWSKITKENYFSNVQKWNKDRMNDFDLNKVQERGYLTQRLIVEDGFEYVPKTDNQLLVGLWSLSNIRNGDVVYKINRMNERGNRAIVMMPSLRLSRMWKPGLYNTYYYRDYCIFKIKVGRYKHTLVWNEDAKVECHITTKSNFLYLFDKKIGRYVQARQTYSWFPKGEGIDDEVQVSVNNIDILREFIITDTGSEIFYDYCVDPVDIKAVMWRTQDLWMWIAIDMKYNGIELSGYSLDSENMQLWQCYVIGDIGIDTFYPTWINTQTTLVRTISKAIRVSWNIEDIHIWRREALKVYDPNAVILKDSRVTGYIKSRGKKKYVVVSGHLINMMLLVHTGLVCIRRYLMTITGNLMAVIGNKDFLERYEELGSINWLIEQRRGARALWHSYLDFRVAVIAYKIGCENIGFIPDEKLMKLVVDYLDTMREKTQLFNQHGFQAKEYLDLNGQ
jgi:hypothetical protein